jgi:antitoxin component of MazEF toxin-antitoxin module
MATETRTLVQHIKKRGNSFYVSIPKEVLKRLAWNLHDILTFQVIDGSVVLTRVDLPKVNALRKSE